MSPNKLAGAFWVRLVGVLAFVALLSAGYYHNLAFVQLGLIDLGTRLVGMTTQSVSTAMAVFAVSAFGVAAVTGWTMDRTGLGAVVVTYFGVTPSDRTSYLTDPTLGPRHRRIRQVGDAGTPRTSRPWP